MAVAESHKHPIWMRAIKVFETPDRRKAIVQLINTLVPLSVLFAMAVASVKLAWPYPITFVFVFLAGLLQTRVFIFFHDCTHGSFFKSSKANAFWGMILGILTFTPYDDWRRAHGIHHNTHGNLDRRGVGDIWTLTLEEYRASSPGKRLWYRIYRHPIMLFVILPPLLFFIVQRFPHRNVTAREVRSVLLANLGIGLLITGIVLTMGWEVVLLILLPMFGISSIVGVWLFYVQHQFDPGYWEREEEWAHVDAAMLGSSHYKLPKILQWVSGNIGLHHIHHARPRIPNYNLQACYDATPELQLPDPLTFATSFRSIYKNVWDEETKSLLSFREAHRRLREIGLAILLQKVRS